MKAQAWAYFLLLVAVFGVMGIIALNYSQPKERRGGAKTEELPEPDCKDLKCFIALASRCKEAYLTINITAEGNSSRREMEVYFRSYPSCEVSYVVRRIGIGLGTGEGGMNSTLIPKPKARCIIDDWPAFAFLLRKGRLPCGA